MNINEQRILTHLHALGAVGLDAEGRRTRLAADDADKAGRDLVAGWMREAGMQVFVDYIGNIIGLWETAENHGRPPIMTGSHIYTVVNAWQYDGCLGVVAGIEVIQSMQEAGLRPQKPLAVAVFTNEEGVRFAPDMMGSLVYAGGLSAGEACAIVGTDGSLLGEELKRIGYAGTVEPGFLKPEAFVELHVEQGPILEAEGYQIGAVDNLQGISWQRITIKGEQNHAGTTPISYRKDAGLAAARVIAFMRERCLASGGKTLATVGCMELAPNAINVIPDRAVFTMDIRNPVEEALQAEEKALDEFLYQLEREEGVRVHKERLSRFSPVKFDEGIVEVIEKVAREQGLSCRRITSGAGQDAQNMACICPTAMVFVPSHKGISHNPAELTFEADLKAGGDVLGTVLQELADRV